MGTRLVARWIGDDDPLPVIDDASLTLMRARLRAVCEAEASLRPLVEPMAVVVTELGRNQLHHARLGEFVVRAIRRGDVSGVEVVAADRGPGIADPTRALRGQTFRPAGLGAGLGGVLRLADEVDIDVRWGEGSCICARKFSERPAWRSEVGILGRPHPEETVSGDDAAVARSDAGLVALVADGLGHGPLARDASDKAADLLVRMPDREPAELLAECAEALDDSRGAAVVAARIDLVAGHLDAGGIGDAGIRIRRRGGTTQLPMTPGIVGGRDVRRTVRAARVPFGAGDIAVLSSDGLRSTADLQGLEPLAHEHPILLAHALVDRFARADDDVTVLVVR